MLLQWIHRLCRHGCSRQSVLEGTGGRYRHTDVGPIPPLEFLKSAHLPLYLVTGLMNPNISPRAINIGIGVTINEIGLPCDHKVVILTHSPGRLADFRGIIANDLDPLKVHTQQKAVLGEVGGVCIDCLPTASCVSEALRCSETWRIFTFPPRTSSPMMMQPAVCIMRLLLASAADGDDMMLAPMVVRATAAAEVWP